jgi:hypothetical protein
VLFVSSQLRHHRAYWVEITERVEKNVETVSVLHPLTQEETEQVKVSRDPARVEAEIDGNTIRVTTANVRSLRLLLNDRMVDLSRPVVVRLNGLEVFRKTVSRSWSFLLEKARLLDREMLFATEIVLEVP